MRRFSVETGRECTVFLVRLFIRAGRRCGSARWCEWLKQDAQEQSYLCLSAEPTWVVVVKLLDTGKGLFELDCCSQEREWVVLGCWDGGHHSCNSALETRG